MVTAYGRAKIVEDAEAAGIEIALVKPVTQSHLFDASVPVLGGEVSKEAVQRDFWAEHQGTIKGGEPLLDEDNDLNQQVAIELLREGGQAVELAKNGEEAVWMVSEKAYATVLLDTQMPATDGVTATEKLENCPNSPTCR